MVLGPSLTIQLALHFDWHYAFIFTSLPTFIIGILIWFFLKEGLGARASRPQAAGTAALQGRPQA